MKKTAHLIALWLAIFVGSVSVKAQQCSFTNPLSPNSHADPFVTFHEGFYYYTFTTGLHVEVRKSATLEGIAAAEPIGVWRSWEEPAIDGPPWAPELHYINGKWYIYTTGKVPGSDEMRVIVLEGDSPQSQFRYVANLAGGIDATILKHTNGQLYMVWMRNEAGSLTNITIAPMTSPTSLGQGWTQISEPNIDLWYNWEKSHQVCNEGPQIIHRNGKFFLTYSANASWTEHYCLGMFTCDDKANVMDRNSWVKSPTPIFQKSYENGVVGVGHASFTTSPDGKEDWILFHGMDDSNGDGIIETGWENRHPFVQRISWHNDGTPNIGIPQPGGIQMTCAGGAGEFVRLQSANFPDRYIRHSESRGRLDAGVNPLGDGQFKMVPGLADPNAVSLESVNFPGHFLRHRNGEVWMDPNYGDNLYKNDATWWVRPGLSNAAGMSFESYNFPGNFIRHRGSLLYSENPGGLPADATFFKIATSVNGGLSSGNTLLVEAENYNFMSGIQIEGCSEGGQNVGWIEADDWMVYDVLLPVAGDYTVEYRVASPNGGGVIEFEKAGGAPDYGTITVPTTGGWQNWTTISHQVNLPAGQQQVAIHALSNGYNLNWFKLTPVANGAANSKVAYEQVEAIEELTLYPNPGKDVVYLQLSKEATVTIRDVQGKIVVKPTVYNSETGLDISSLDNGMYFMVIETDDTRVSQKLVVKK